MKIDKVYEYVIANPRIIDGDTIECDVGLGFGMWKRETFRLYGINTPEIRGDDKVAGYAAKDYLQKYIENSDETVIRTIKDKQGKYGRYLAIIICTRGDIKYNVNDLLLEFGYAVEYMK